MRGDLPHVVLGLLIVPFYFIIKYTADRVRDVLFSAVIGHKKATPDRAAFRPRAQYDVARPGDARVPKVASSSPTPRPIEALGREIGRCAARPLAEVAGHARRRQRHAQRQGRALPRGAADARAARRPRPQDPGCGSSTAGTSNSRRAKAPAASASSPSRTCRCASRRRRRSARWPASTT